MRQRDEDDAARIGAQPWQLALLDANPKYVHWGPHEDYMWVKDGGWNSPQIFSTWEEFGPCQLDDLNECVNFYFHIERDNTDCPACEGTGYHPDARKIVGTFYPHMCDKAGEPRSSAWHDKITQDEVQALVDADRLHNLTHDFVAGEGWKRKVPSVVPTAAEVNALQHVRGHGFVAHDGINQHILTVQRIKRVLGLDDHRCPHCEGRGYIYTAPEPRLCLTMWWLHPRKGGSRGFEVSELTRKDLPAVQAFLRQAAARNAERFSKLDLITEQKVVSQGR